MCCFRDFLKVKGKILKALSCTDAKIIRLKIDIAVTVIHRLFLRWCGVRQNFLRCWGVPPPPPPSNIPLLIVFLSTGQADKIAEWWHHHHSVSDWKVTVFSLMISAHAPISDLPLDHIIEAPPTLSPSSKGPSLTFLNSSRSRLVTDSRDTRGMQRSVYHCRGWFRWMMG